MQLPDNYQQQKIEKLIKALGIDLEFTGKEIAEILNSFIPLKSPKKSNLFL